MSETFEEALNEFGEAMFKLKRAYAEQEGVNPNHLSINVNSDNDVTITPGNCYGSFESYRTSVYEN